MSRQRAIGLADLEGLIKIRNLNPINMNTLKLNYYPFLWLGIIILSWPLVQRLILWSDVTIGFVDPNIWLLLMFSIISFSVFIGLSCWLLKQAWQMLALPPIYIIILQFKNLNSWQQLSFLWASFALLLFSAVAVFSAVL
jgi:hypothetical protein